MTSDQLRSLREARDKVTEAIAQEFKDSLSNVHIPTGERLLPKPGGRVWLKVVIAIAVIGLALLLDSARRYDHDLYSPY
jgi:hypothetical protein